MAPLLMKNVFPSTYLVHSIRATSSASVASISPMKRQVSPILMSQLLLPALPIMGLLLQLRQMPSQATLLTYHKLSHHNRCLLLPVMGLLLHSQATRSSHILNQFIHHLYIPHLAFHLFLASLVYLSSARVALVSGSLLPLSLYSLLLVAGGVFSPMSIALHLPKHSRPFALTLKMVMPRDSMICYQALCRHKRVLIGLRLSL